MSSTLNNINITNTIMGKSNKIQEMTENPRLHKKSKNQVQNAINSIFPKITNMDITGNTNINPIDAKTKYNKAGVQRFMFVNIYCI